MPLFYARKNHQKRRLTRRETWFFWSAFVAATAFAVNEGWSARADRNDFNWRLGRSGSAGQSAAMCRSCCCACLRGLVDIVVAVVVVSESKRAGPKARTCRRVHMAKHVPTGWLGLLCRRTSQAARACPWHLSLRSHFQPEKCRYCGARYEAVSLPVPALTLAVTPGATRTTVLLCNSTTGRQPASRQRRTL